MTMPAVPATSETKDSLPPQGAETTKEAGAAAPEAATSETPSTETPPKKTYSEEEWNKRQSALDKQLSKWQQQAQEYERKATEAEARAQEQQVKEMLSGLEESGYEPDKAKQLVASFQAQWKRAQDILARESEVKKQTAILAEACRSKMALDLAKEHGLAEADVAALLEAEDAKSMELEALKLAMKKTRITEKSSAPPDSSANKGVKRDFSKMPASQALGMLMEEAVSKK